MIRKSVKVSASHGFKAMREDEKQKLFLALRIIFLSIFFFKSVQVLGTGVRGFMFQRLPAVRERLVAQTAGERLDPLVISFVRLERRIVPEALVTKLAQIRVFAGVNFLVLRHVRGCCEPLVAGLTFVWFFTGMYPNMSVQEDPRFESFPTMQACIAQGPLVGVLVLQHLGEIGVVLRAELTAETFVRREMLRFGVLVQTRIRLETGAAFPALVMRPFPGHVF